MELRTVFATLVDPDADPARRAAAAAALRDALDECRRSGPRGIEPDVREDAAADVLLRWYSGELPRSALECPTEGAAFAYVRTAYVRACISLLRRRGREVSPTDADGAERWPVAGTPPWGAETYDAVIEAAWNIVVPDVEQRVVPPRYRDGFARAVRERLAIVCGRETLEEQVCRSLEADGQSNDESAFRTRMERIQRAQRRAVGQIRRAIDQRRAADPEDPDLELFEAFLELLRQKKERCPDE